MANWKEHTPKGLLLFSSSQLLSYRKCAFIVARFSDLPQKPEIFLDEHFCSLMLSVDLGKILKITSGQTKTQVASIWPVVAILYCWCLAVRGRGTWLCTSTASITCPGSFLMPIFVTQKQSLRNYHGFKNILHSSKLQILNPSFFLSSAFNHRGLRCFSFGCNTLNMLNLDWYIWPILISLIK